MQEALKLAPMGLDPGIGYPQPIANDAMPVSNHPMKMTGSSPVMTGLDHCVRYVNSKRGWHYTAGARPAGPRRLLSNHSDSAATMHSTPAARKPGR